MKMDLKKELNSEQLEVVEEGNGAAFVIAGPGSGKTRTLIYRIAKLVNEGINLSHSLDIPFRTPFRG
jgi:DNA helicase-2/ATP-dependent DNA helicase PcrA